MSTPKLLSTDSIMKFKFILVLLLILPSITLADVNFRTGDFYISYTDIEPKDTATTKSNKDHELKLERIYHSKPAKLGMFGFGWGAFFETHLTAMPDGTAVIQENGCGRINYYHPEKPNIESGVKRIIKTITERDKLSPDAAETLHKSLISNEELRLIKVQEYAIKSDLTENTVLQSVACGSELKREKDHYTRTQNDKSKDIFNLQGQLIRHEHPDGYVINITHENNCPVLIKDSLNQTIQIKCNDKGLIIESSGSNSKNKATYSYDEKNHLILFVDKDAQSYHYQYDNHNNLTRIEYMDKSSMTMDYDPNLIGYVRSVTEKTGEKTQYEYRKDPKDQQHYWTKVTQFSASGEQLSTKEYEYKDEATETGNVRLMQIATNNDQNRTTDRKYDAKGRIISKRDEDGQIIEYTYHPKNGKIASTLKSKLKTDFSYDKQNNLIKVKNSAGQKIVLDYYPNNGDIKRIIETNSVEKTKNELRFKYNIAKQISEIELVGVGKTTIEYDEKGEMTKVDSKQGDTKTALKIIHIFHSLMEMTQVNEGFNL